MLLTVLAAALQFSIPRLTGITQDTGSYQIFLAATALSAVWAGRRCAFVTLVCCAVLKWYFFLPPYGSFHLESVAAVVHLVMFAGIGIVICLVGGAAYESQEMLSSTLSSIGDAVVATHENTAVSYINPVAASLSGWKAEDVVGRPIADVLRIIDERTLAPVLPPIDSTLCRGSVSQLAKGSVLVSTTGTRVPVEGNVAFIPGRRRAHQGMVMVFRDMTAQREAGRALRESEARYRFLVDAVPEFIFTADTGGDWNYANHRWYDYTGLGPEQSLGRNWVAAIHEEDAERCAAGWDEAVRAGTAYEVELRIRNRDGVYRSFLARGFPMCSEQGAIVEWLGIGMDIEELKRSQQQLSQATKMEAMGRLAGGVAHDFNNLLTVIIGYANVLSEMLERQGSPSHETQEILSAANRAAALTSQLLTFSRHQIVERSLLDINYLVRDIETLLRRLIGEDVRIRVVLEPGLLPVRIDRSQMEQVIINLAVNARDAMPGGGHLILETANVTVDAPALREHMQVEPGRYVMLVVTDTGHGMDQETQSHIFEPFFTTKETGKGTGLGLSTVYGIVRQNGGHIAIDSEPGHGTTFRIYLPAVLEAAESARPAAAHGGQIPAGPATILILEDEVAVRQLVKATLAKQDYTVLEAANPVEALQRCKEYNQAIDLLITDVVMPGMSGREVAELAARYRPSLKVLYMSGYTGEVISHHGVLASGAAFLQKPFSSDDLLRKVGDILHGRTGEPGA